MVSHLFTSIDFIIIFISVLLSFRIVLSRGTVHELQRWVPTPGRVIMALVDTYERQLQVQRPSTFFFYLSFYSTV